MVALDFHGVRYEVGIGTFPDDDGRDTGRPAEVFVTGAKAGSDMQSIARDGSVLLSIALQYGAPLDVICRAITRLGDGVTPTSFLGALSDTVANEAERIRVEVSQTELAQR